MQIQYKSYSIEINLNREQTTNKLGLITSYSVSKDNFHCYFIFAESLTNAFRYPELQDRELESQQIEIVKNRVDNNELQNYEEYTFQLQGTDYFEEARAAKLTTNKF